MNYSDICLVEEREFTSQKGGESIADNGKRELVSCTRINTNSLLHRLFQVWCSNLGFKRESITDKIKCPALTGHFGKTKI